MFDMVAASPSFVDTDLAEGAAGGSFCKWPVRSVRLLKINIFAQVGDLSGIVAELRLQRFLKYVSSSQNYLAR